MEISIDKHFSTAYNVGTNLKGGSICGLRASTLYTPTRVTLGKGAEDSLGDELKRNGAKKVLVHYGSERIVRDGLMKRLTDQMDREGIEYVL